MERSARGARREFTLYGGEDALDQRAERVPFGEEMLPHLQAQPEAQQLERRLAGITLRALSCWRQKVWLHSESNSASASMQPMGVCRWALLTSAGSVAQSFHGACRVPWARISCRFRSTTASHFNQCVQVRWAGQSALRGE